MKKRIILISIIVVLLALVVSGVIIIRNNSIIRGEKINDYIYFYNIDKKENDYISTIIKNDNIFYLLKENEKYSLYKRNIHSTNVSVSLLDEVYEYCIFVDGFIECIKENYDTQYYDYNLKPIYSRKYNESQTTTIVYNGKFLELSEDAIYEGETLYRKLNLESEYYYQDNFVINDNTYLIFCKGRMEEYLYYDIKNDKYEKISEPFYSKYNNGFYIIKPNGVLSYDVMNNSLNNYEIPIITEDITIHLLNNDIFYTIKNHEIFRIDLSNKMVDRIEYKLDKDIDQIIWDNSHLYLITNDNEKEYGIYLIDIDKINKTSYTLDEFQKFMDESVEKKINDIETKYHVHIKYKDQVNIDNETFRTTIMDNDFTILSALDEIEEVLDKFNVDFFDEFYKDKRKGINIYLSGALIPKPKTGLYSVAGFTFYDSDVYYEIAMDITSDVKDLTCHELMHVFQNRMDHLSYYNWNKLNPKNFDYKYSYNSYDDKYTTSETNPNNVYFTGTYAKTYLEEDLAETFKEICGVEENSMLLKYPHLYKKAMYLKKIFEIDFPMLKTTKIFDSLKN